jgi:steroid Delta-isomerase
LGKPHEVQILAVAGQDAEVHFRAIPAGGEARNVIDTMTFDDQAMITVMPAYGE